MQCKYIANASQMHSKCIANALATAWQLDSKCMASAWQLHGKCRQLHSNCAASMAISCLAGGPCKGNENARQIYCYYHYYHYHCY